MIGLSITPASERELNKLHGVLQSYLAVSKRDVADTLARKANDVRIQLFRGYWAERMKGPRKGARNSEGIAFRQMRQRARAGQGVVIRPLLQHQAPSTQAPVEYFQRRKLRGRHGTARRLRVPVTMSTYQRRVWTELARRQAGIGVLGVAFLMQRYRKRWSTSREGYVATGDSRLRANKTGFSAPLEVVTQSGFHGTTLGRMTLAPDVARLDGFVPGHSLIGETRSVLATALRNVRHDTEKYLARKAEQSLKAELGAAGVRVT